MKRGTLRLNFINFSETKLPTDEISHKLFFSNSQRKNILSQRPKVENQEPQFIVAPQISQKLLKNVSL